MLVPIIFQLIQVNFDDDNDDDDVILHDCRLYLNVCITFM
jgi:hypothetical protein